MGRCNGANIQVTYSLTVAGKKGNLPMMMMMMRLLIMVASCGCRCWRGVRERVQECMQICKIYYERPYLMVLFIADVDAHFMLHHHMGRYIVGYGGSAECHGPKDNNT